MGGTFGGLPPFLNNRYLYLLTYIYEIYTKNPYLFINFVHTIALKLYKQGYPQP